MKYFVSYTTRDTEITRDLLELFSLKLKNVGKVFIDLIDNNSKDKQSRVIRELDSSDFVILVESQNIYKSDWVLVEIERAISKNIPIRTIKVKDIENISSADFYDYINNLITLKI